MRKISFLIGIIALIITGFGVYSCQNKAESEHSFLTGTVVLKFELQNKEIKEVVSSIKYIDGVPRLVSEELEEIFVVDKNTGKKIPVFVLKEIEKTSKLSALSVNVAASSESGNCQPEIRRGYGFDGRCFSYGTTIVTNDCEQYFYPAPVTEYIGFDRICPGWNEAYARDYQRPF